MRCNTCGNEVGLLHECAGPSPLYKSIVDQPPPLLRFAPLHYLSEAIAIARFDDKAILRMSRDNNAFLYGVPLWFLANLPALGIAIAQGGMGLLAVAALIVVLPIAFLVQLGIWGVCHLAARILLKGQGTFASVSRAMLPGSIVAIVGVVPLLGGLASRIWALAIMMIVFETVHGIRRLHAFAISFVVGLIVTGMYLLVQSLFGALSPQV